MTYHPVVWSVVELAEATKKRIENKYDSNILVTGLTGKGKSSFLFKFFNKFPDFKIEDKLTYDREELIHLLRDFQKSYAWHDELISAGNKRKFYDTEQIELIQVLTQYRSNLNIFGGAVPIFFSLDKELLKLIGLHINIIDRGVGVVHLPREGRMYNDDPWDVKINSKLEEKWSAKRQKNPNFKIPYQKYTTFAGYVRFGKMTDKQEEYYEELKRSKRHESDGTIKEEPREDFNKKVLNMIKEKKLDEEGLLQLCLFEGKKLSSIKITLRTMLKDEGNPKTLNEFFKESKKDKEIDSLHNNSIKEQLSKVEPPEPKSK